MHKATTETARKMLQLVRLDTNHGKLTWLMIAFLHNTRASFIEIASLRIGDVYRHGAPRQSVTLGEGQRQRTVILGPKMRQVVEALVLLPIGQGHRHDPDLPLFRLRSGHPFEADQMASIFWLYQEAAEGQDKS